MRKILLILCYLIVVPQTLTLLLADSYSQMAGREKDRFAVEKDKEELIGVRKGMIRSEVEDRAAEKGIRRYSVYSCRNDEWILEYRYETQYFKHVVLVDIDKTNGNVVRKFEHNLERKW